MQVTKFRLGMVLVVLAVVVGASAPAAPDMGACCVQTTSRLETLLNPKVGSDELFFSSGGNVPNVMMVLDTSCSMNAWPEAWPSSRGCNHPGFAGTGYDPNTDYPGLVIGMGGSPGARTPTYHPNWFNNANVFRVPTSSVGHDFSPGGSPVMGGTYSSGNITASIASACADTWINDSNPTYAADCVTCLATAGYYVRSGSRRVATGNFLEYYGPRDVSAVMAMSNILYNVRDVRIGVMTFDNWGGTNRCWGGLPCLWKPLAPACSKLTPIDEIEVENQRINILNGLAADNGFTTATPLATSLYAAGYNMRSKRVSDGFDAILSNSYPTDSDFDESSDADKATMCTACGFNAVMVFTDGEPNEGFTVPEIATNYAAATAPVCAGDGVCTASHFDEIAAFLWNNDIRTDLPGIQRVATYTIGFGTSGGANRLLDSAAKAGGGKFYNAKNTQTVVAAFTDVLQDVVSRNNQFASAAVANVQAGSSSSPALLPRMSPVKGDPWKGYLWRFEQFNEFVEDTDLDLNGSKEGIFIVQKTSGAPTKDDIVTETSDGKFVLATNTSIAATPHWEANAKLVSELGSDVRGRRKVWTVFDTNNDGAFTSADGVTRVQFNASAADDLKLAEYMGIRATPFCPSGPGMNGTLISRLGISQAQAATLTNLSPLPATPTQADYDRLCVRLMVLWLEGADLLDADADNNRIEARANVLGDIFHSAPVVVEPPTEPFLCELGLSNQCVRTLYSSELGVAATPQATGAITNSSGCGNPATPTAYEAYTFNNRNREKVVLVGANDGMIHAFVSSRASPETCLGGKPVVNYTADSASARAGLEAWAFIPPDQLPKLPDMLQGHQYMVDGDIMVRDIWNDDNRDGIKQHTEFHTLAVISEGRGGKHYIALEVPFTSNNAHDRPNFRWVFPQPCSEEAATFGSTFFALSPKPPPVGPVLIDPSSLPSANLKKGATPVSRRGQDTLEQWVVALSGGWSPGLEKGRGVYMVDAWEGQVNGRRDNLWWKFEFDESASGFQRPARELVTSVTAPVALVDYGANDKAELDGFFDTAIFGDTSGQMWVARMYSPGRYDSSAKRITNWAAARTFEMDRDGVPPSATGLATDAGTEAPDPNAKSNANKWPFFYLPSVAVEPGVGKLRVFAGTGNRYALLEQGAGMCRFDNPAACSKSGCSDTKVLSKYEDSVVNVNKLETHWKSRRFEHGKEVVNTSIDPTDPLTLAAACGSNGSAHVRAENEDYFVGTCDLTSGVDPTPGKVNEARYACGLNSAGTNFSCNKLSSTRNGGLDSLLDLTRVNTSGLGNNRYFGFWAYGGLRTFVEEADGGTTPDDFDDERLSDRSASAPNNGDLVDVTRVSCTTLGACDGGAGAGDYGWFLNYNALDTKTASGSTILSSCVLWSDLAPVGGDGGTCGTNNTPMSALYQADFITGQPNCAYSFSDGGVFVRSQVRTVVAPPPEPASVVQISKTGQVRYSAMVLEPGKGEATTVNVSGSQDMLQVVYQLPVSRALHNCRHADGGCVTTP